MIREIWGDNLLEFFIPTRPNLPPLEKIKPEA